MKFAETELRQIAAETWRIVLNGELIAASKVVGPAELDDPIAACAQIVGDWQLAAVLYCPMTLARRAAAIVFGTTAESARLDDVHDTICELISIIAGNVKGMLSGSSFLSLPNVVKGSAFKLRFPRHVLLSEVAFTYASEPVVIMLLGEDKLTTRLAQRNDTLPALPSGPLRSKHGVINSGH